MNSKEIIEELKKKQYTAIIHSEEYKQLLKETCKRIVKNSKLAPNEATIESYFDCELFSLFRQLFSPLGFEYNPIKEASVATTRHITKGRADTAIGTLVIEFKQPSTLKSDSQREKAVNQIATYLCGIDSASGLIGYVTDGTKGCFVEKSEHGIKAEPFCELSSNQLDRLIQSITGLNMTALSSHNLVYDFCNPPDNDGIAFTLVKSLYNNLKERMTDKTEMLFREWKELFNLAHDDISKQQAIIERKQSLEALLGVSLSERDEEYTALFALQTAYAIIVKVVAYRIVSMVRYKNALIDFESLKSTDKSALRYQLQQLEDGAIFREYGITNLLEGDFFSWYCTNEQWSVEIANSISSVFNILSMYSDKAILNTEKKSADFFKELYQGMMPAAVRHSLGEYYTKRWIAKQVVEEAIEKANIPG